MSQDALLTPEAPVNDGSNYNCLKVGFTAFIKSDYMLENLRISKYSNKVKIFDRSRQSAGNPLKISGILEGGILHKKGEDVENTSDNAVERLARLSSSLLEDVDSVSKKLHELYLIQSQCPTGYDDEWKYLLSLRDKAIRRLKQSLEVHGK